MNDKNEEDSKLAATESVASSNEITMKNKGKGRGKKRKRHNSESSSEHEDVLADNSVEVDRSLLASAIKNNLDETSVRKIIKKVVTNDRVLALVKMREEEDSGPEENSLRPKLTRAKVKELMKVSTKTHSATAWNLENMELTPIKHIPVKTRPEVKALIAQDLPEDEDDEEYQPTHDDVPSDDEQGLESCSDLDSQPRTPATPRSQHSTSPKVIKDGPFKVPQDISTPTRRKLDLEEDATIALRTRSKLSLSATSIEHIESTFIPPDDIPMPVDDLWNQFLNECLNPASTSKNEDDDETDPEYNVAADQDALLNFFRDFKLRKHRCRQGKEYSGPWEIEENLEFVRPSGSRKLPPKCQSATISKSPTGSAGSTSNNNSQTQFSSSSEQKIKEDLQDLVDSSQSNSMLQREHLLDQLDDIDLFFLGMARTTKKLTKQDQLKIKSDLYAAIYQSEKRQFDRIFIPQAGIPTSISTLTTNITTSRENGAKSPTFTNTSPANGAESPTAISSSPANGAKSPTHISAPPIYRFKIPEFTRPISTRYFPKSPKVNTITPVNGVKSSTCISTPPTNGYELPKRVNAIFPKFFPKSLKGITPHHNTSPASGSKSSIYNSTPPTNGYELPENFPKFSSFVPNSLRGITTSPANGAKSPTNISSPLTNSYKLPKKSYPISSTHVSHSLRGITTSLATSAKSPTNISSPLTFSYGLPKQSHPISSTYVPHSLRGITTSLATSAKSPADISSPLTFSYKQPKQSHPISSTYVPKSLRVIATSSANGAESSTSHSTLPTNSYELPENYPIHSTSPTYFYGT